MHAGCIDGVRVKMPEFALANDLWLGRERTALQNAALGLRAVLALGRPCFRKLLLGKGKKDTRLSGFTGRQSHLEALPPHSRHFKDSFVVIFGQTLTI